MIYVPFWLKVLNIEIRKSNVDYYNNVIGIREKLLEGHHNRLIERCALQGIHLE